MLDFIVSLRYNISMETQNKYKTFAETRINQLQHDVLLEQNPKFKEMYRNDLMRWVKVAQELGSK